MRAYLLDKFCSYRSYSAEKEIEHLILGQKKGVVNDIERLAKRVAVDYERDVSLGSSLSTSYDTYAAASKSAEEFACDTGRMLHVFPHDGYGCKPSLHYHRVHSSSLYLLGKFFVEHLCGSIGIVFFHTNGSGIFRRSLRYHEDRDAILCKSGENASVHAYHSYH